MSKLNKKKYPNGGNLPTKQDSLNLMNNAIALDNFYKTSGYRNTGQVENQEVFPAQEQRRSQFNSIYPDKKLSDYYSETNNPNQYKQRETAISKINFDAPMGLYDKRIKPNKFTTYAGGMGDLANVPSYDPLSVTPWDNVLPEQRQERINKYGVSGTPYKTVEEYQNSLNPMILPKDTLIKPTKAVKDTNIYTAKPFLQKQGAPTGYENYGDLTGRKEFKAQGGPMTPFKKLYLQNKATNYSPDNLYKADGGMLDYYKNQMAGDQQLASSILGTVGGIAGNIIAPGIGGQIGSTLGQAGATLFNNGGNMASVEGGETITNATGGMTEIPNEAGTHEQNPNEGVNINNPQEGQYALSNSSFSLFILIRIISFTIIIR